MKKIRNKILLYTILSSLLVFTAVFVAYLKVFSNIGDKLIMEYELALRAQVDQAISLCEEYNQMVEKNIILLEEAKKNAADRLRELKCGQDGCFWRKLFLESMWFLGLSY